MPENARHRIAYIDWARGLACLVMFQTHCYDSWLGGEARDGRFSNWSRQGGTLPAPLFLFLAGISFALLTDKLREKGMAAGEIASKTIRRGAEVLGLGLLFRVQEYLPGGSHAPWTDLFRVDILNVIGVSLMMMGAVCWVAAGDEHDVRRLRGRSLLVAVAACAAIATLTPLVWTSWRPHWRAWWLESYIDGVHTAGTPQSWLFPIFPWAAFAFAGLAIGFLLRPDSLRRRETAVPVLFGAGGAAVAALGYGLDASPVKLYASYDFWHTSPNFFLIRLGGVMLVLMLAYAWCRWGAGQWGFSPLIEMGKCSLLVYWVHIEFVYGRFSIVPKEGAGVATATLGLLAIFIGSTLLAVARNRFSSWGPSAQAAIRRTLSMQTSPE